MWECGWLCSRWFLRTRKVPGHWLLKVGRIEWCLHVWVLPAGRFLSVEGKRPMHRHNLEKAYLMQKVCERVQWWLLLVFITMAFNSPLPLISQTTFLLILLLSSFRIISPILKAFLLIPSFSRTAKDAIATRHPSGLPPKVDPCVPTIY